MMFRIPLPALAALLVLSAPALAEDVKILLKGA
jgi:hypothetical protein